MHVGFVGTGNMGGPMATNVLKAGHELTVFDARAEATASLDRQTVGDVLNHASGASFILERKLSALVAHDYRAGFFVDLAWKDLCLALELAERAGARTEVARQAWELYGEASRLRPARQLRTAQHPRAVARA
jgi:3-hydroxyisobutyrate dehydrogenase-like beta-hydroxyacid dehydrogenase